MNSSAREVMWRHVDGGVEHARITVGGGDIVVDGVLTRAAGGTQGVQRIHYVLRCDDAWRVVALRVEAPEDGTTLALDGDGAGAWRDGPDGALRSDLRGCIDIDLFAVAFTNTLPIRRLAMAVGESHLLAVAFVRLPSMEVVPVQQRYTRLDELVYRYESVSSGFRADLRVDAFGLVVEYPGLARQIWTDRPPGQ